MRKPDVRKEGVPDWVVTFADLMTLLFCFFVLLTTLSTQPKDCSGIQAYLDQNKGKYRKFELRSSKLECVLSLPSDFMFRSGSADIQRRAMTTLVPLFKTIKKMKEHEKDLLIIEGHTDNVPIRTRRFNNNWELSSARATKFANFLVQRLRYKSQKLSVRAYADSRPKVEYIDETRTRLRGNTLRKARSANRRVEIILVKKPKSRKDTHLLFDGQ